MGNQLTTGAVKVGAQAACAGGVAPRPAGVPGAVVDGALGAAEGRGGVKKWREKMAWKLVA